MIRNAVFFLTVKEGATLAYGDFSGVPLPADLVREARKLEIEYVRKWVCTRRCTGHGQWERRS